MPAKPAFKYDLLRDLYLQHADEGWSTGQYQLALTRAIRETDPHAEMPPEGTIRSVLSRHRHEWDDAAHRPPRQTARYTKIAPPPGTLASEHKMHPLIRYLRDLAAAADGTEPTTDPGRILRRTALNWSERMHGTEPKQLVDLTPAGMPIVRQARPEEIDSEGNVISLAAWMIPGWRQRIRV